MARILISHVTPSPDTLTGISMYTWKIVEALARHGRHDYVLATNWHLDKLPPAIISLGLPLVHRDVPRNETAMLVANSLSLPRLRRQTDASLIFHPQPTSMIPDMARSVVTLHDLYRVTNPALYSPMQLRQWRYATAPAFCRAGRLIAVSEATRQAVLHAYPRTAGRVSVVHEASPVVRTESVVSSAGSSSAPYGLMVANITPNKNVALLFEALDLLARSGWKPRIVLAGRDDAGLLPALFTRFPDVDVTTVGSVSDAELAALYAGAAVYINTSLVEGFCLPILEAHTWGVPVICADIPVLREVAGEGAIFIDPTSPASLAGALRDLLGNERDAAAMRVKALVNDRRFSWEKAARETEAVFDEALDGDAGGERR